jgi:N-acetyl sugar amidotransferase
MPETWAGITFDNDGVCNICREYEKKQRIDWGNRQARLDEILAYYRKQARENNNKYDCLVGYSGGKDTAYTLWAVVKKYGMRPLAFTFDHGFKLSPEGEYNLEEVPKVLDIDHLRFTLGNGLRNSLCKLGSKIMGDFCWHCHAGVGAMPARISKLFNIPLQIWGEPSAEYQTTGTRYTMTDPEEQNEEHFIKVFVGGLTSDRMIPDGYELLDLMPLTWPKGNFPLKAIYLGNYEPWNQREHVEIIKKELGWKGRASETAYVDWDKVDCLLEDLREYQKYMRRGFGKVSFQASKDIREGLITRAQGLRLVKKYEGKIPSTVPAQLDEIGMTKAGFDKITNRKI